MRQTFNFTAIILITAMMSCGLLPEEVQRRRIEALKEQGGLLYDQGKPYTGIVEGYYPNDSLKLQGSVTNGLKTGEWVYLHTYGDTMAIGRYKNSPGYEKYEGDYMKSEIYKGGEDSLWVVRRRIDKDDPSYGYMWDSTWYANGRVIKEHSRGHESWSKTVWEPKQQRYQVESMAGGEHTIYYKDSLGRMQGLFASIRYGGTYVYTQEYKDGKPHGEYKRYDEDGNTTSTITYRNGEKVGVIQDIRDTNEVREYLQSKTFYNQESGTRYVFDQNQVAEYRNGQFRQTFSYDFILQGDIPGEMSIKLYNGSSTVMQLLTSRGKGELYFYLNEQGVLFYISTYDGSKALYQPMERTSEFDHQPSGNNQPTTTTQRNNSNAKETLKSFSNIAAVQDFLEVHSFRRRGFIRTLTFVPDHDRQKEMMYGGKYYYKSGTLDGSGEAGGNISGKYNIVEVVNSYMIIVDFYMMDNMRQYRDKLYIDGAGALRLLSNKELFVE